MSPIRPRKDKLIQISPDQVVCDVRDCGKTAAYILHRHGEGEGPAALAFCGDHVKQIAGILRLQIPGGRVERRTEFQPTNKMPSQ